MKKVNYYRLERWGWECPCGQFNETEEDPSYEESLICEDCGEEFEAGQEE